MNMRPTFLLLVTVLALFPLNLDAAADETDYTAVGENLPEIDFTTTDGVRISNDTLDGKVVVFNMFATWCGPCRGELPHLEKDVWQAFKDHEDFELVVVGREHTAAELNAFRSETGYTFPLAADPERATYSLFAEKWIPRNYVIDRDGTIVYQSRGFDEAEFAKMIDVSESALKAEPKRATAVEPKATGPAKAVQPVSVTVSGETRIRVQRRDD